METQEQVAPEQTVDSAQDKTLLNESSAAKTEESTLLGETAGQEVVKLTPEQEADNKRILGAKDDELSVEDKAKKAELVKAQESTKPAVVPEKYEAKLAEGMTLDQGLLDKFTPIFKELKISQEGFQKLIDIYAPHVNEMISSERQRAIGDFNKQTQDWKVQSIKELGADYLKEMSYAARFIDKDPNAKELREILEHSRLGNHPRVLSAFIRAGKMISQDSLADSKTHHKSLDTDADRAKVLYPSMQS